MENFINEELLSHFLFSRNINNIKKVLDRILLFFLLILCICSTFYNNIKYIFDYNLTHS